MKTNDPFEPEEGNNDPNGAADGEVGGFHGPTVQISKADDLGLAEFAEETVMGPSARVTNERAQRGVPDASTLPSFTRTSVPIPHVTAQRSEHTWMWQRHWPLALRVAGFAAAGTLLAVIVYWTVKPRSPVPSQVAVALRVPPTMAPAVEMSRAPSVPIVVPEIAATPEASIAVTTQPTQAGTRPALTSPSTPRATTNPRPVLPSSPLPEAPPPVAVTETPAVVVPAPIVDALPAPPPSEPVNIRETEIAQHRTAVLQLLDAYRDSYDRLDVVSTARLWPGVDTAALSRAFSTLSSQHVEFDSCTLDLDRGLPSGGHNTKATAVCHGSLRYVRRVGNTSPQSRDLAWTFELDRSSGRWLITAVRAR